jgi:hypothetical protein
MHYLKLLVVFIGVAIASDVFAQSHNTVRLYGALGGGKRV